jgi:hypothetical protein
MFFITRKSTGQVVGRDVAPELLELVLSNLPTGTYAVEDSDGRELHLATVKRGRVTFAAG